MSAGAESGESSAGLESRGKADGGETRQKRGPYIMSKAPSLHNTLQKHKDSSKKSGQKRIFSSTRHKPKMVKFNKGYAALSQMGEESLISLDSDSDAELDCSSGYSSAEVHPDLSRQLLKDGYHLDEIPDDEDLDLIPPKALSSSVCCCRHASCCLQ